MRRLLAIFSGITMILVMSPILSPLSVEAAGTVTITPSDMQGWGFLEEIPSGNGSIVNGPGLPPFGNGSANLVVDDTGREIIGMAYSGTLLSDFTRIEYSTYRTSGSANLGITLQFNIDDDITDLDNAWKGRLVFEPSIDNVVTTGEWQTWDALAGRWWASGSPINGICTQGAPCDMATILSNFPNAGIHPVLGGVLLKAGGPWTGGFDGNTDGLILGLSGSDTTYNFETSAPNEECEIGTLWQIGDIEADQLDNPVDENPFNWPGAFGIFPPFDDPFIVGTSNEFPYNSKVSGGAYADDFDVTFNYTGPETATATLHVGWAPSNSAAEQKEVLHNAVSIGTTPVRNGAVVPGWWNDMERFVDTFPLTLTPGAQTLNFKQLIGNGTVWDYIQLEITDCDAGSSSSSSTSSSTSSSSSSSSGGPVLCNGLVPTIVGTPGNDLINGTNGDDVIVGLGGNDLINGKKGNDTICTGDGNDLINGHKGNDWIDAGNGKNLVNGHKGNDTIFTGDGNDLVNGHKGKDTISTGAGNDLINGHGGQDIVSGGPGNDSIRGHGGHDVLSGGSGDDSIRGGGGNDEIDGGDDTDFCKGNGGNNTIVNCE